MKKIVTAIILLMLCVDIKAQGFYSMANAIDSIYASDVAEDGPKNNIRRMRLRWEGQFNTMGKFTNAAQNFHNFASTLPNTRTQTANCTDFEPTWHEIGPKMLANNANSISGVGQINRLTFHPNYDGITNQTIFGMSYYGGMWKTVDDGENWVRLNTDIDIPFSNLGVLVIDPNNPSRMYITTGAADGSAEFGGYNAIGDYPRFTLGIYATDNGGNNWYPINNGMSAGMFTGASIFNLVMDPTNPDNLIFTSTEGVFTTKNATSPIGSIIWAKDYSFPSLTGAEANIVGLTYNIQNAGDPNPAEWYVSGKNIYSTTNPFAATHAWVLTTGLGSGLDLTSGYYPADPRFEITRVRVINSPFFTNDVYGMIYTHFFDGIDHYYNVALAKKTPTGWFEICYKSSYPFASGLIPDKINFVKSPNANDFFIGSTHYGYYESSSDILTESYGNGLGGNHHADVHGLYIHPAQPTKLWLIGDGGVSKNTIIPGSSNSYGFTYKNVGLQNQLLWDFDDSEQDKNYLFAALQDNGMQFIGGSAGFNWGSKPSIAAYTIGDGYNADIMEGNPTDAIFKGNLNPMQKFNYLTGAASSMPFPQLRSETLLSDYFPNPQLPGEKVFIGGWKIGATPGAVTVWGPIDVNGIDQIHLSYNNTIYQNLKSCGNPFLKTTYQKNVTTAVTAYAIAARQKSGCALPASSAELPSLLFKSNDGYSATAWNYQKADTITNALYNKALLDGTINAANIPALTGVSCKPEDGNKVWVSSYGLIPWFKVYKSSNGGKTWENADPLHVFENIPVFDVLAVEGSLDIVFAATQDGVYYTNNTMGGNWCRYGKSPSVQTFGLKVNYCKNKLIVSTYGCGAFEVDLPYQPVPSSDITVNTNWNHVSMHFPKTSVTVKSGVTLTINNNSFIYFGPNSRLIVEAGAKLELDNSSLMADDVCNGYLWQGVELQGDFNQPQVKTGTYYPNHGWCTIINDANIINAVVGVKNYVSLANGDIDWSKMGGGIIQSNHGQFLNCSKGASFITYINKEPKGGAINDESYFKNTLFNTVINPYFSTKNYMPEAHISMWNTNGIGIVSNTFLNSDPSKFAVNQRGCGIIAYDASFDIITPCSGLSLPGGGCATYPPNTFDNLFYGIDASASLPSIALRCNNTLFTDNHRGVALHGIDYAQVMDNNISLGPIYSSSGAGTAISIAPSCGIYLDACDAFAVKNNTVQSTLYPGTDLSFGIVSSYSNINPNELKQNKFYKIGVGIQAQENNNGLQLKCNQFLGSLGSVTHADVKVMGQSTYGSIAAQQGLCPLPGGSPTTLPGNEFSHTCGSAQDLSAHTYDPSAPIQYNARTSEAPVAGCFNAGYYNLPPCLAGVGNVCTPSTGGDSFSPLGLRLALANSKQDVSNLKQLLAEGNAPSLYTSLASGTDAQINTELLAKSPYLSDSVLMLFLAHNPQLTDATLKNVLLANSPLSSPVFNSYKLLSINEATVTIIDNAQVGQSQRKYTELGLAYEQNQLVVNYNNLISYTLNDKDNVDRFDSLVKTIDYSISPSSRAVLVGALIEQRKFTLAQAQLDSLQTTTQHRTYLNNLMLLRQAVNQKEAYTGLIKTTIDSLKLNRPANVGVKAQALYNGLFKHSFGEEIYVSTAQANRFSQHSKEEKIEQAKEDFVKVYPNPATNELYFLFKTTLADDVKVNLYDVNGRLVKTKTFTVNDEPKLLELNDLKDGIYFYQILSANTLVKSNKVVIIK